MTTIIKRKYRISRRYAASLWGRAKDAYNKRNYPPGQHGSLGYKKPSDFGKQFAAHKRFKCYYAINSKQMRNIFLKAYNKKGDTGDNFVGILESRLSTVLYNSGLVPTIFSAKQLISHKLITVNGKTVNISSYVLKPNDIIKIKERAMNLPMILATIQSQEHKVPDYIETDIEQRSIKYLRVPKYTEVVYPSIMNINLVIEFFSR